MDFPGNSQHRAVSEDRKLEKIVTGGVKRQQKSLGRRFLDTFVSGADARSVFEYVLFEVIIPAAKDLASDALSQAIDKTLYTDGRGGSRRSNSRSSGGYVSYNRFAQNATSSFAKREEERRPARATDFDDIVLETRAEAIAVIDQMFEIVSRYQVVKVADLYELIGETPEPIHHKWGWTDLRGAAPVKTRVGYLLDLPKPEPL